MVPDQSNSSRPQRRRRPFYPFRCQNQIPARLPFSEMNFRSGGITRNPWTSIKIDRPSDLPSGSDPRSGQSPWSRRDKPIARRKGRQRTTQSSGSSPGTRGRASPRACRCGTRRQPRNRAERQRVRGLHRSPPDAGSDRLTCDASSACASCGGASSAYASCASSSSCGRRASSGPA